VIFNHLGNADQESVRKWRQRLWRRCQTQAGIYFWWWQLSLKQEAHAISLLMALGTSLTKSVHSAKIAEEVGYNIKPNE